MKKFNIYLGFVLVGMFILNTAQAQFNYGAKKKTPTNQAATKDTTVAPEKNVPVTTAPPATVDPNIKSVKTFDTTLVGGFNAKTKKSLRNNYAFFSETNKRKGVQEKIPLPYENLREEDALFSEFLWEEIDGREKINRPFTYQSYDDNGDQRFFAILLRAIEKEEVVPFSADGGDDRFTQPITNEEVNSMLKGKNVI